MKRIKLIIKRLPNELMFRHPRSQNPLATGGTQRNRSRRTVITNSLFP